MPLWYDLEDSNKYLYHYTARRTALSAILPKKELMLGLFRYMNDPRESKDWAFSGQEDATQPLNYNLTELSDEATRLAKATTKLVALTRDDPVAPGTGFGQFGRGFAHSALWAHYGGGHTGVCLVFDRKLLGQAIEDTLGSKGDLFAGPVTYADAHSDEIDAFTLSYAAIEEHGLEGAMALKIETWHPVFFFRKSREWENEREYRWVLRSPEPVPQFVPIKDALRAVVVGHDFPDDELEPLDHLLAEVGVQQTARCRWENGVPQIFPRVRRPEGAPPGISLNVRLWAKDATKPSPPPSLKVEPR
jgi:hypothetical protein